MFAAGSLNTVAASIVQIASGLGSKVEKLSLAMGPSGSNRSIRRTSARPAPVPRLATATHAA